MRDAEWPGLDRGEGPAVLVVPGFGLRPSTYRRAARAVEDRFRVLVPEIFGHRRRWDPETAVAGLWSRLDGLGVERPIIVGHSFGGGLALGLAARRPDRVGDLVFADSVGLAERWRLAASALTGASLFRLTTPRAAFDWVWTACGHPARLARAGWWAFVTDQKDAIEVVRRAAIRATVVWAERDTLVPRQYGRRFAERLAARFSVMTDPDGSGPVDHDWVFRHPHLFASMLYGLLGATAGAAPGESS